MDGRLSLTVFSMKQILFFFLPDQIANRLFFAFGGLDFVICLQKQVLIPTALFLSVHHEGVVTVDQQHKVYIYI